MLDTPHEIWDNARAPIVAALEHGHDYSEALPQAFAALAAMPQPETLGDLRVTIRAAGVVACHGLYPYVINKVAPDAQTLQEAARATGLLIARVLDEDRDLPGKQREGELAATELGMLLATGLSLHRCDIGVFPLPDAGPLTMETNHHPNAIAVVDGRTVAYRHTGQQKWPVISRYHRVPVLSFGRFLGNWEQLYMHGSGLSHSELRSMFALLLAKEALASQAENNPLSVEEHARLDSASNELNERLRGIADLEHQASNPYM